MASLTLGNLTWLLSTLATQHDSPSEISESLLQVDSSGLSAAAQTAFLHVIDAIGKWVVARDDEAKDADEVELLMQGVEDAVIAFGALRAEEIGEGFGGDDDDLVEEEGGEVDDGGDRDHEDEDEDEDAE